MQYVIGKRIALVLAVVCLTWAGVSAAEVYRWVDEEGKVHYSDRPVQGSESVDVSSPPAGGTGAAGYSTTPPEGYPAGEDPDAERAKVRAQQCELAQTRLKRYREAESLLRKNEETGEETELTADERIELIVQTQRKVREMCGEEALAGSDAGPAGDGSQQ